ncbi:MAG: MarR family winged helix-turn-helix transcriptional regulator [Roseiflexaceae bacterium]
MESPTNNDERDRIAQLAATCAWQNLRRAARAVTSHYDALLKQDVNLRITQVTMLVVLYLAGPQTINDMAEHLGLDRTTLTRNLKPIAHQGLLTIAPGADQRTRIVTLTAEGEQRLLQVLPLWEEAQAYMVEGIGREHFAGWIAQLSAVTSLAQAT